MSTSVAAIKSDLTHSLTHWLTRSPIELSWTVKNVSSDSWILWLCLQIIRIDHPTKTIFSKQHSDTVTKFAKHSPTKKTRKCFVYFEQLNRFWSEGAAHSSTSCWTTSDIFRKLPRTTTYLFYVRITSFMVGWVFRIGIFAFKGKSLQVKYLAKAVDNADELLYLCPNWFWNFLMSSDVAQVNF